jgi:hypothetical protein
MRTGRIIGCRLRLERGRMGRAGGAEGGRMGIDARQVFVPTEQIAEQARALWATRRAAVGQGRAA